MKKDRIHLLHPDISSRVHPINICVIGAGGNGGFFLQELARMAIAYQELFDNTFYVQCYDGDKVEEHNTARQLFFEPDIGQKKSNVMISRINLTYGFDWESIPRYFKSKDELSHNFVISCVDSIKARKIILDKFEVNQKHLRESNKNIYHIDIGNMADYGQVILGTNKLNEVINCDFHHLMHFGEYYDINKMNESKDKNTPSCSVEDSLNSQSLYINRLGATLAANLMWDLLRNEYIDYHGYFYNLKAGKVDKLFI